MATHGVRAKWDVMKLISRGAEMGAELLPAVLARGVLILAKAGLGGNFVLRLLRSLGLLRN